MRKVKYTILPPTGPGTVEEEKDLFSFLLDIPNFFYMGYVPPFKVVNILLAEGLRDAGMSGGCEWDPFNIDFSEYEEILEWLKSAKFHNGESYDESIINVELDSKQAWYSKVLEFKFGIPFEKHLEMSLRVDALELKSKEASKTDDEELKDKAHLEWYYAANELNEFEDQFINKNF